MLVEVKTAPKENRQRDSFKNINWSDSSDRKWLMNHLHWAMNNRKIVSLTPLESN